MLQIKRSVLSTALASAVLITATSAVQAQQAPQDEAQTDTDADGRLGLRDPWGTAITLIAR